jgi:hypothetical protein
MWLVLQIINRELLEERFGSWPSFHDAEVYAVRLDSGQRSTGRPSLELDIHVFDAEGKGSEGGWKYVRHTVATFLFDGVEVVELGGFGHQNVLDDLLFEDLGPGFVSASRIGVSLPSNNGLGGAFRCETVTVLAATPFEPGPHSVYRADA